MRPPRRHRLAPLLAIASFFGWAACEDTKAPEHSPLPVVVSPAIEQTVPVYQHWVGSVAGFNNAQIRPQVRGYLLHRNYEQGTQVDKGELLFEIDPREFQAGLDAAKGQLGEALATLKNSELHVARYGPLAKEGAISQQEYEDALQSMARDKARVASARANEQSARLNLQWTKIQSPIQGVAGISDAQIGDLVTPTTTLTTVSQLDPVKVRFPVSEQEYLAFIKALGRPADGKFTGVGAILELRLADNSIWPHPGTPFILGREVDPLTGTILVEGQFPNPDNTLRPGLFARVRAHLGNDKGAVLIPQRAVNDVQGNHQVAVVQADDHIAIRNVQMGDTVGENWIVKSGLKAGEHVVVEGLQKVRDGMKVAPRKASKPAASGSTGAKTDHPAEAKS